jgi:4-carboxymuconolactone decarboxylase
MTNPDRSAYERGIAMRRQVLGDEHVERSTASASEFSRPVQELVTEYIWGSVWTREGLDLGTRSLLNLVMLTALGRMHEFGVHVRGAINNGCTPLQIREALVQAAVYCGAPAALESFRVAERVLAELSGDRHGPTDERAALGGEGAALSEERAGD